MATVDGEVSAGDQQICKISVKVAPFYRNNPRTWFRQLESQFAISGISNATTKYHYVLANLPEDVALSIIDTVSDPSESEKAYDEIKSAICTLYTKSKNELIEEALGQVTLDGEKPSFVLARIKRKLKEGNLTVDNDLMKHKLLQALPAEARAALAAHQNLPPDEFAKLADTILEFTAQKDTHRVFSAKTEDASQEQPCPSCLSIRYSKSRTNSLSHSREFEPFSTGQRPKICRYHIFFGERARRCKVWCQWPGRRPANIDPPSRAGSRSSSPVRTEN